MKCRILVVEDSPTQAEALRALLEAEGHRVSVARSGEEAFERLTPDLDLVLSDVVMPGIDGYELCRRIKAGEATRQIPVVLLTSLHDPMAIVHGLEAGADNYITKPYEPAHLVARVSHVLHDRRLRRDSRTSMGVTVSFMGAELTITSDREQILDLLLASVEEVIRTNRALEASRRELQEAHHRLESYAEEREREARALAERYRGLMQHAGDAIFLVALDGTVVEANARAEALLGLPASEIVGRPATAFIDPSERSAFARRFDAVLQGDPALRMERTVLHASGRRLRCEATATRVRVREEEFIFAIYRDVTERREAEERLLKSERRLAEAQKIARIGSWEWVVGTDYLEWSDEMYRICGLEPSEYRLTLSGGVTLLVPEDRPRLIEALETAVRDLQPMSVEVRLLREDNPAQVLSIRGEVVTDAQGKPVRMVGTGQDITPHKEAARRLEDSQERYRSLFQYNPDAVFSLDAGGAFTSANPACEAITGYDPQTLLGRSFEPLIVADQLERVRRHFQAALRGEPQMYETAIHHRDGHRLELSVTNSPVVVGGEIVGVFGIAEDIGERMRARRALEASEERYRLIFDGNPMPMWIFDRETSRILMVNTAAVEQYGYSREEFAQLTLWDLRPPEDAEKLRRALAEPSAGLHRSHGWRHRRKDGTLFEVEIIAHPVPIDGRQLELVMALDVSDRVQAERALRENEQMLRALVDAAPVGIILLDADLRLRVWNPGAAAIFGWEEDEVLGHPIPFIPEEGLAVHAEFCDRLRRGEPLEAVEAERLRKDGTLVSISYSAAPLRAADGSVSGAIAVIIDITERRALEEQLRQSQKMDAIGQLAGGVAHDFNNLLTVIKGNTELALADVPPEHPLREDLEEIAQTADRAANLTRQLLTFSRKQVTEPRVLEVGLVVGQAERLLRRVLGEHIRLVTHLEPDAGCVRADLGQMEQVLMNLAVNARDAMAGGGTLTIAAARAQARGREVVRLSVSDTGGGIAPEIRDRIFEPFFTTKPPGQGTGLGLSTVYGIVAQSDGEIAVQSEVGRGTTFEILLPRVEATAPAPAGEADEVRRASGTVLLVEDEAAVRRVAQRMLERFDYTVHAADGGTEALAFMEAYTGRLDLVVTDVVMPGISGQEVARRARERFPDVRVLFMSGYTDEAISHHGVLDDGVEFIHKPFTPETLARRVAEVIGSGDDA